MSCSLGQDKLFDLTFDLREVYENDGHIPLTCHFWSSPDESILLDALKDPTGSRSSSTKSLQSFSWVGDLGFHFFEENHSFVLCHYHHVIKPLAIFSTRQPMTFGTRKSIRFKNSQFSPFLNAAQSQVH